MYIFRVAAEMLKATMNVFYKNAKKGPLPSFFASIDLKNNIEAFKMVNCSSFNTLVTCVCRWVCNMFPLFITSDRKAWRRNLSKTTIQMIKAHCLDLWQLKPVHKLMRKTHSNLKRTTQLSFSQFRLLPFWLV